MNRLYKIADVRIRIDSLYDDVHRLCEDYLIPDKEAATSADIIVQTAQADIDFEQRKSAHEDEIEGIPVRQFSDSYLETLAVYRKISEKMPDFNTVLFHGSAVAVDEEAYLFTAKSGTGKSTHTKLWRELLGDRAVMVNDDKPLVRINDNDVMIYGTPWDGKHRLSTNIAVPLKAVCILERAGENTIRPATLRESWPVFFQQIYRPSDPAAMAKTLKLIDSLATSVRLWRLGCNTDIEAAQIAYSTMGG